MEPSLEISQSARQIQIQIQIKAYAREALKAFKKVVIQGSTYYTCNVKRLRECDRLGDEKEISTCKTHFFLRSRHFDDIKGVIFNSAPGEELAIFSERVTDEIYVALSKREMVNPKKGEITTLDEDLNFASET
jgi:hypothetical protein